jgi:predicted amidohydrolase/ribosomal protein S18 acetylase RimI-like enzyme
MTKINLQDFERRVRLRTLKSQDYERVVELQKACFPGMTPWSRDQFESLLSRFPEGQLCVEYRRKLVASSSSLIVDFDLHSEWHDWKVISDNGYIRNHDYSGDTLYGIEIMVHPDYRGMKLARRIYNARKDIARERNLTRIAVGGRIPGYYKYKDELSASEYVEKVVSKEIHDPVLTAQLSNGFVLRALIPDYFPSDEDSAGYATHLEWTNPFYIPDARKQTRLVQMVRVCAVQYQMRAIEKFEDFARQVEFFVDTASEYHSDFVVFPELFTTQLLSFTPAKRPGEAARRLAEFTPDYLKLMTRMAVRFNINIIGGSQFFLEEGILYNTACLFRRDGSLAKQRKIHITPSEQKWWGVIGGNRVEVFDTDRGKISILICYDIEFPELARLAVKKGAYLLFVPFNTDERHGYLRVRICSQARCIENNVYVVTAGCVGNLPFVTNADIHYAQSAVFTPSDVGFSRDGIAAECTPGHETIVLQDLDLEMLRRHRFEGAVRPWADRRRDLYRVHFKNGEEEIDI